MIWFLIYWIICGLITFSLTEPTVFILTAPLSVLGEFLLCMLVGGVIIPVLAICFICYIIKVLVVGEEK